jgi:uncharacterized protein (TIGR02646 family)
MTMVPIPDRPLPSSAAAGLTRFQGIVDVHPDYPSRVEAAKAEFKARNTIRNTTFRAVRQTLNEMCHGSRRCMYCEDAPADEVEHFQPKDLYPEVVFAWGNYLYACGICNGPKNNRFSIVSRNRLHDVTRGRGRPVVPPRRGRPALINPREEDPLDFLMLDLMNTFEFVIISPPGSIAYERAKYTLEVLRLNEREYLRRSRRTAFGAYCSLLRDYGDGVRAGDLARADRIRGFILESSHATVWAEMKRQRGHIAELGALFDRAPDALTWT